MEVAGMLRVMGEGRTRSSRRSNSQNFFHPEDFVHSELYPSSCDLLNVKLVLQNALLAFQSHVQPSNKISIFLIISVVFGSQTLMSTSFPCFVCIEHFHQGRSDIRVIIQKFSVSTIEINQVVERVRVCYETTHSLLTTKTFCCVDSVRSLFTYHCCLIMPQKDVRNNNNQVNTAIITCIFYL